MSAKRQMLRADLKTVGWRGKKAKRRPRGLAYEAAAHEVAVTLALLKARDRMMKKEPRP